MATGTCRAAWPPWIAAVAGAVVFGVAAWTTTVEGGEATTGFDELALARIRNPPLGLPAVPLPVDNEPTAQRIRLGRKLFLDRRISSNGTLSCAMCHVPEQGFTVNEIRTAVGNQGKSLRRNAPTLLNVAYAGPFFHDGREPDLDLQAFDVFLNPDEMAAPSIGAVVHHVGSLPDYRLLFAEAFDRPPGVETIGQAIGTYMRTLISANSEFDRWYFGGEAGALGEAARRGFRLFTGKAGCATCHAVGEHHALFTDGGYHDTGIGWFNSVMRGAQDEPVTVEIAPGVHTQIEASVVRSVGDPRVSDLGRYEVTGDPADRWHYKTPSLRSVSLTAPYMHDGSMSSLRAVLEHYNRGGHPHEGLDAAIRPLGLSEADLEDLQAFLNGLTGDNLEELVRDARSERIGNPGDGHQPD